ncbi:Clc-like protein [Dictyocaulus viviparus]|uniref:Clc-like protein n=1 Tax=Dictyocaulus viviparus TaxID=29172 RepID=A0A0D8XUW5_DICVI|nr:Clc-like protein [Dictyocaulus viviparus]
MAQQKGRFTQTCILVVALILIVIAFALSAAGLFSPSWQVVDIREFRAEHHHGLWLDCTRAERHLAKETWQSNDLQPLHCTYKFDFSANQVIDENNDEIDQNSESEHHQFFAWHKAVLVCFIVSMLFASLALCCGLCAPCNGGCAVIFTIFVFLSLLMGVIGDCIFFFAAHRVDNRFVQGLVGTYEQRIGVAFYLHGVGTLVILLSFIVSVVATYQILRKSELSNSLPLRELAPLYSSRMRETFA